ncbi:hypothetical protein [Paenibacillus terrae]|uniref:hypothetical protein n=1 Tax=Paenibacillus terrae TaxID=159743 RepID=UPI0011EB24B6|nr:hypothetical protein [Paenibacillus terrae]
MESITIGPFTFSLEMLIGSASVLAGYFVLKWRLRVMRNVEGTSIDHLMTNIFIAGLFIWKFSPLILDFQLVIHDPMSLIYLNGGTNGLWIAALFGCIVLMIHTWRKKLAFFLFPDVLLTLYLASSALYGLLHFILLQGYSVRLTRLSYGHRSIQIQQHTNGFFSRINSNRLMVQRWQDSDRLRGPKQ